MQPDVAFARDLADRFDDRIDRRRRRRADRRDRTHRPPPVCEIVVERARQRFRLHAEIAVDRDPYHVLAPDAERDRGLLDVRVRLIGDVDAQHRQIGAAGHPAFANLESQRFARRGERRVTADRGRVVDDAVKRRRQPEHLAQPPQRDIFQLGRGRRGAPQHRVDVECGGERFGEDRHRRRADRKVRKEARMVPVRDARYDQALEIAEDRIERLRLVRRRRRERRDQVAGLGA